MIEFGAFLLSPSPAHIRGGGAASSYIWIVGLPIIEMVTTRVWERGGHARGRGPGPSRGHRALSPQQVVTWRPLATTPPPAPRQGGNNYRGRALTHLHLHTPCTLQLPGGPRSPWRPLIRAIQTLSSSLHSRRSLNHFSQSVSRISRCICYILKGPFLFFPILVQFGFSSNVGNRCSCIYLILLLV